MNFKTKTTPGFGRFPNATGESDIVHTAARRLFQVTGTTTAKLLISSLVLVLGGPDSVPTPDISRPHMSFTRNSRDGQTVDGAIRRLFCLRQSAC